MELKERVTHRTIPNSMWIVRIVIVKCITFVRSVDWG